MADVPRYEYPLPPPPPAHVTDADFDDYMLKSGQAKLEEWAESIVSKPFPQPSAAADRWPEGSSAKVLMDLLDVPVAAYLYQAPRLFPHAVLRRLAEAFNHDGMLSRQEGEEEGGPAGFEDPMSHAGKMLFAAKAALKASFTKSMRRACVPLCSRCGVSGEEKNVRYDSNCLQRMYCEDCQMSAWKEGHREVCKTAQVIMARRRVLILEGEGKGRVGLAISPATKGNPDGAWNVAVLSYFDQPDRDMVIERNEMVALIGPDGTAGWTPDEWLFSGGHAVHGHGTC
jgi:hypothetical protein